MAKQPYIIFIAAVGVVSYAIYQFQWIYKDRYERQPAFVLEQKSYESVPLYNKPIQVAAIYFENEKGEELKLADMLGKVVLLNIWATWCVPCREEMPTLDELQRQLGGKHFEVVALSIDQAGADVVREFYAQIRITDLQVYIDQTTTALNLLGVLGIPTTLLLSPEGQELGRIIGPATWDSPEMIKFLESTITDQFRKG